MSDEVEEIATSVRVYFLIRDVPRLTLDMSDRLLPKPALKQVWDFRLRS